MDIIKQICQEIERLKKHYLDRQEYDLGWNDALEKLLAFLDTLQEPEKPIDPKDAMKELDEKIALVKQNGTWDGVDVDKYMDEVRGIELKFNLDRLREVAVPLSDEEKEAHRKMMDERRKKYEEMGILQGPKSTRQRLAEWSKTPEGREAYEKVAKEMRKIAEDTDLEKEISEFIDKKVQELGATPWSEEDIIECARHFYNLARSKYQK